MCKCFFLTVTLLWVPLATSLSNSVCGQTPSTEPRFVSDLTLLPGFQAERLYDVPQEQGSWISMTFDPQGRIITSSESGGLYRVTPASLGNPQSETTAEKLQVPIGRAQGLAHASDCLYVVVGTVGGEQQTGLYRVRDTDSDDQYDQVEQLLDLRVEGEPEHGPHAVVLGPENKWLYVIAGNSTQLPTGWTRDRVASLRGARGHAPPGPQGWVLRLNLATNERELFCVGLRNAYDMAVGPDGELMTCDSDLEGYMGMPWYRPTSVYHLVSGADFAWHQGPGILQPYQPDICPPVVQLGPGSPTGMVFGTAANFPEEYRRALFVCDWSYGRIHAVDLKPDGATYSAQFKLFLSGRPLPAVDIQIGPDGAMYFITGGRHTRSSLYRVTYAGAEESADAGGLRPQGTATSPPVRRAGPTGVHTDARALRNRIESFHGVKDPRAIDVSWPHLASDDRAIRYAARVAVEHQDVSQWQERALGETNPQRLLTAVVALARQAAPAQRPQIVRSLGRLHWDQLSDGQRLEQLRAYQLTFKYMKYPESAATDSILRQLDPHYPSLSGPINRELSRLLFDLDAPNLLDRTIIGIEQAPSAAMQIYYLQLLGQLDDDSWTETNKKRLQKSLELNEIRETAQYSRQLRSTLARWIGDLDVEQHQAQLPTGRKVIREWTTEDLLPQVERGWQDTRRPQQGKAVFRSAMCQNCHRIGDTGGVLGPNLTGLAGRFTPREALESITEPSKVVADQFRTTIFITSDGKQVSGRIVDLKGDILVVQTDPLHVLTRIKLSVGDLEEILQSDVSLMPTGLLNHLTQDEILDLLAYIMEERAR